MASLLFLSVVVPAEDSTPPLSGRTLELFVTAKGHFEKGRYKDAEKLFKECKSSDKSAAKHLKPWLKACKGGKRLDKLSDSKNPRRALAQLKKLAKSYADTPLRSKIDGVSKKIYRKIYYPLSTFETVPPENFVHTTE